MKIQVAIVATALTIAVTVDSAAGLAKYLNELPNGSNFVQALGHIGDDSSKTTDFAQAFAAAGHTWSSSLCEAKFPSSTMTNGAAFGDPCCTWKKGAKPEFTVTAFTTTPGKATTCASKGGASSSTSSTAGSPAASSPESSDTEESGASNATKGASDATKGAGSAPTSSESSSNEEGSTGGASDATKGGAGWSATTPSESNSSGQGSTGGAGDATKGSPWGASTVPTSGGGCAAKSATKSLRR